MEACRTTNRKCDCGNPLGHPDQIACTDCSHGPQPTNAEIMAELALLREKVALMEKIVEAEEQEAADWVRACRRMT